MIKGVYEAHIPVIPVSNQSINWVLRKEGTGMMPFLVGYGVPILGALLGYYYSVGKTKKRRNIFWGIVLMFAVSPFLSFAIGLTYAILTESGWAAGIMFYIFPIIFIIGLVMLLVGIFKKEESDKSIQQWYSNANISK